jgi:hypothetical protein
MRMVCIIIYFFASDINITGPTKIEKGHDVKLTCNLSGFRSTPKDIRWYLNGSHILNRKDSNIKIVTFQRTNVLSLFSELDIGNVNNNKIGNYSCKATFRSGLKEANYHLYIDALYCKFNMKIKHKIYIAFY